MTGAKKVAQVVAVAVGLRAIVALVKALVERWNRWDGLDSVVSFSSRMIAASRAVETQEEHALVRDPLAKALAGGKAFASSLSRAKNAPPGSSREKQIGMMSIRTRWFDDQILAALHLPVSIAVPAPLLALPSSQEDGAALAPAAAAAAAAAAAVSSVSSPGAEEGVGSVVGSGEQHVLPLQQQQEPSGEVKEQVAYVVDCSVAIGGPAPRQVVLLGAGMDSRPWRLDLPAGVRWFEVDRQDVLSAKADALERMDAQLSHSEERSHQQPGGLGGANGSDRSGSGKRPYVHPLRAASWAGVACDLCTPGWAQELAKAGFDPGQPTVWVAEGLLMYFTREEAEAVLQEMAGASAPGSVLVTVSITNETLAGIQQRSAQSATTLTSTWKFGCPRDPRQFLARLGWRLENVLTRGQMAHCLGLNPALCAFKLEKDMGSIFFVASAAAAGLGGLKSDGVLAVGEVADGKEVPQS